MDVSRDPNIISRVKLGIYKSESKNSSLPDNWR